jgi:hypothetical protein
MTDDLKDLYQPVAIETDACWMGLKQGRKSSTPTGYPGDHDKNATLD